MPFKKGDPKPPTSGRKKDSETADVRQLAAQYTREAIERLVAWMRSDNPKASTLSAQVLLNRAHGSPAQTIIGAIAHEHTVGPDFNALSGKLATTLSGRAGADPPHPTVQ